MASGHVYRGNQAEHMAAPTNAASEDSSCQPGAVHTWPFATFSSAAQFGGYRSTTDIHPGLLVMRGLGRTVRAGVSDRAEDIFERRDGFIRCHAGRRIPACDVERALAGVRVGAVLHPAVLLAFPDGAGLLQHGDRLTAQRPDRRSPLARHQHRSVHPGRPKPAFPSDQPRRHG